jgi:hypothetical protein
MIPLLYADPVPVEPLLADYTICETFVNDEPPTVPLKLLDRTPNGIRRRVRVEVCASGSSWFFSKAEHAEVMVNIGGADIFPRGWRSAAGSYSFYWESNDELWFIPLVGFQSLISVIQECYYAPPKGLELEVPE